MAWVNLIDLFWPIGSIYYDIQDNNNDPTNVFGGTWVEITEDIITFQTGKESIRAWKRVA